MRLVTLADRPDLAAAGPAGQQEESTSGAVSTPCSMICAWPPSMPDLTVAHASTEQTHRSAQDC
ncbi:hypothetical protein [Acrocarpospora sp. B8E8]|uniref:hypothetical protein n=1 Tax=Acrocarpospora sp. B8E8 TaxID=3153572 RepID=UPI00325EABC4